MAQESKKSGNAFVGLLAFAILFGLLMLRSQSARDWVYMTFDPKGYQATQDSKRAAETRERDMLDRINAMEEEDKAFKACGIVKPDLSKQIWSSETFTQKHVDCLKEHGITREVGANIVTGVVYNAADVPTTVPPPIQAPPPPDKPF